MRGGKRAGAGRPYRPAARIWLANRYVELKWQLRDAGVSNAGEKALEALHAEEHPDGEGSLATTWRLIVRGRHEEIFLSELAFKLQNQEPLSAYEQSLLRKLSRRRRRRRDRRAQPG